MLTVFAISNRYLKQATRVISIKNQALGQLHLFFKEIHNWYFKNLSTHVPNFSYVPAWLIALPLGPLQLHRPALYFFSLPYDFSLPYM